MQSSPLDCTKSVLGSQFSLAVYTNVHLLLSLALTTLWRGKLPVSFFDWSINRTVITPFIRNKCCPRSLSVVLFKPHTIREQQTSSAGSRHHPRAADIIRGQQSSSAGSSHHPRAADIIRGQQTSSAGSSHHPRAAGIFRGQQSSSAGSRHHPRAADIIREQQTSSVSSRHHP
ncbi:hypothetical protein STEG23_003352 [Scotinomys teguina]